jgi:hypothetical protein
MVWSEILAGITPRHSAVVQPEYALDKICDIFGDIHWAFTAAVDFVIGLVHAEIDGESIAQVLNGPSDRNDPARGMNPQHRRAFGPGKISHLLQIRSRGSVFSPKLFAREKLALPWLDVRPVLVIRSGRGSRRIADPNDGPYRLAGICPTNWLWLLGPAVVHYLAVPGNSV